jgi:hypothetical protein
MRCNFLFLEDVGRVVRTRSDVEKVVNRVSICGL